MIGIISAMVFEKQHLLEMIQVEKEEVLFGIRFSFGKINRVPIVIASCGEGKVNAARCAQIMICCYNVKTIINIGVAGSMKENVKRGDIVVAKRVVQHDYDMSAIGVPVGLVPRGVRTDENPWGENAATYSQCSKKLTDIMCEYLKEIDINYHVGDIATGDIFVADNKLKNTILSHFDVLACEMEGAAIAYVCNCAGIDFGEMRDISDNADSDANDSYWLYRKKYSLSQILYEIINNNGDSLL